MMVAVSRLLLCFALASVSSARRLEALSMVETQKSSLSTDEASFIANPGSLVDERFELKELLRSSGHVRAIDDEEEYGGVNASLHDWPRGFQELAAKYGNNPQRAGEGAFGEVWLAKDRKTDEDIAVKLFKNGKGGYIMCGSGSFMQRRAYAVMLKEASDECKLSQKLTMGMGAERDPIGASRIAKCIIDGVGPKLNAQSPTACYLVLENGGVPLDKWVKEHRGRGKNNPAEARVIVKQILQAVRYMNRFKPAYIHHDMKPDNTVFKMENGFPVVKLIDWGCAIEATSQYQRSKVDPEYAPPEYSMTGGRLAFAQPAYSFDMFQVGLIYLELLCPDMHLDEENAVDAFGRMIPKSLWFPDFERLAGNDFRRAGCCVDDRDPDSCVINEDVKIIRALFRHSSQRPHPNNVLHTKLFHNIETEAEKASEHLFEIGELVEYYSSTHKEWIKTEIVDVLENGMYYIDVKQQPVPEHKLRELPEEPVRRKCPTGSIPYKDDNCICDSESGFVLSADGRKCVESFTMPAPAEPQDEEWCSEFFEGVDAKYFPEMCNQWTVQTRCAYTCRGGRRPAVQPHLL